MTTDRLVSEIVYANPQNWIAGIIDRTGRKPESVDARLWKREMRTAARVLEALKRPGVLIIVHPDGYGQ